MSARKARIEYSWMTARPSKRSGQPVRHSIIWSLYGCNDVPLVSSFPQGFDTKRAAQANVEAVCLALSGGRFSPPWAARGPDTLREVGPGRKPE